MNIHIQYTKDGTIKYPPHKHEYWEIMLYTEGKGYMFTELKDIPFDIGTIIIIPPCIVHGSVSEKGFKNISIGGEFGEYFLSDEPIITNDNHIQEGLRLASIINDSIINDNRYINSLVKSYIFYILQLIKSKKQTNLTIDRIVSKIKENAYDCNFRVTNLLNECGYNEDYIRSLFKKETGMHPTEYLTKIRIEYARFLIDIYGQSLQLSKIAEICGYTDYVYFSKQFKKHLGIAPNIYKKSL